MALQTYSSKDVYVTWSAGGKTVNLSKGWAEDTFLTIEPLADRNTATFGADGQMCISKGANKGATITMTFQQTANANKSIAAIAAAQDLLGSTAPYGLFTVTDTVGDSANFIARNAVLTQVASNDFGNTVGEKSWTWICESYILAEDPATVLAEIDSYIKAD